MSVTRIERIENARNVVNEAKRAIGIEKRSTMGKSITCVEGKKDIVMVQL